MDHHQTFKIHNEEDFRRITNGIKIAQCMRFKSSISESEKTVQLDDLVVSDSLSCNFCNTVFEDRDQQRLHYKLDWHRYNLKQRLHGLKTVTEDAFGLIADKDDVSSISGSESESDEEESEAKDSPNRNGKNGDTKNGTKNSREIKKGKVFEIESSDEDCNDGLKEEKKTDALIATANRHTKVFFENEDGHIFSLYRCLLHNKKDVPEQDSEMIAQALDSGRRKKLVVIMLGGGHFAAAVFLGGEAIVHKTFHCYTVRAKQGASQSSRDNRNGGSHPKSAGASLRRYNENALVQHVQDILSSWSTHINEATLILYRAVGPQNRTVLFGGKNPPLDKNDLRLRPLPFPTRRATFKEVKRVYDIVSSMEIYGPAVNFADSFPISPRQPLRKKVSKLSVFNETDTNSASTEDTSPDDEKAKNKSQIERQSRGPRSFIDRAKPRKSPARPLPFEVELESDQSSVHSGIEIKDMSAFDLIAEDVEISFKDDLQFFEDTVPRHLKSKKHRQKKRKERKERAEEVRVNEVLTASKVKLWSACQLGDVELFDITLQALLSEVEKSENEQNISNNETDSSYVPVTIEDVKKLVNDPNEEGNTMLHIAALKDHIKIVWSLLTIGSNPCNKNKKLQTPYATTKDQKTRNTFRRFMGEYPDNFDYNKSQIPGPLNDEIELEELERKKQQKKLKREKEKVKKKEQELKKKEEAARQSFLNLSDREKRAVAAERRMQQGAKMIRCFNCGTEVMEKSTFEYDGNKFCCMTCLKGHRANNKPANCS